MFRMPLNAACLTLCLVLTAITAIAQMSPEEARKAMEEAKPTYEQFEKQNAELREENAKLRRQNAALKAKLAAGTQAAEDPATGKEGEAADDAGNITSFDDIVKALPDDIRHVGDAMLKSFDGRKLALPTSAFKQSEDGRILTTKNEIKSDGVTWDVYVTSRPGTKVNMVGNKVTATVYDAYVRMIGTASKHTMRLNIYIDVAM